jgi:hypothetical protein
LSLANYGSIEGDAPHDSGFKLGARGRGAKGQQVVGPDPDGQILLPSSRTFLAPRDLNHQSANRDAYKSGQQQPVNV